MSQMESSSAERLNVRCIVGGSENSKVGKKKYNLIGCRKDSIEKH